MKTKKKHTFCSTLDLRAEIRVTNEVPELTPESPGRPFPRQRTCVRPTDLQEKGPTRRSREQLRTSRLPFDLINF